MEQYHLAIFIFNTLMVLADTALGYHLAPRLLAGMDEPEAVEAGVRTTRGLLPVVVALYMFFSCLIATKTRNLFGLSFRFQIQTIMKKYFENVFDPWRTPAHSDIRPAIEFAHFPFQRRCC